MLLINSARRMPFCSRKLIRRPFPAPPSGSCKVLDVGGRYPGLYTVVGSYNDRGDYYSENQTYNIFYELESSSPSSSGASSIGDNGDNSDSNDDDKSDDKRRMLLNGEMGEKLRLDDSYDTKTKARTRGKRWTPVTTPCSEGR